jgi:hypothetical protein
MKQYILKAIVSSIILVGHFAILILILIMYLRSGFTFSEATTTISIFLPITSVYTSAIVKDVIANKEIRKRSQKKYSIGFVLLSCTTTLLFVIYILAIIIIKAYNFGIADFGQFKALLLLGETIFAAYIGQIVHAMFASSGPEPQDPQVSLRSSE